MDAHTGFILFRDAPATHAFISRCAACEESLTPDTEVALQSFNVDERRAVAFVICALCTRIIMSMSFEDAQEVLRQALTRVAFDGAPPKGHA